MKFNTVPFFYETAATDYGWGSGPVTVVNAEDRIQTEEQEATTEAATTEAKTEEAKAGTTEEIKTTSAAETKVEEIKIDPPKDWRETVTEDELIVTAKGKLGVRKLLEAAGADEETIKFHEWKAAGGKDTGEYLRIKSTDYKAIGPEQLIELGLREKYASLDKKKFDIVLKNELKKYSLDREEFPEESEEAILGGIMLDQDANAIRAKYLEKQEGLKAPELKPDTTAQDREIAQKQIAETIRNSEPVKALTTKKTLSIGAGEEAYNYEVKEDEQVINAAIKASSSNGVTPTASELSTMLKVFSYFSNPDLFESKLIAHGKVLGERAVRKEIGNVQPNSTTTNLAGGGPQTDADLLAASGKVRNPG